MSIKNPLRYPGAKSKLFDYVKKLLQQENLVGCTFYEPFAGSCALSLRLLEDGIIDRAIVNEKDPLIYYFWQSVFFSTDELINLIQETPINLDTWEELSAYRKTENLFGKTTVEKGFAGLFLNRTNFSGILNANPLGGKQQSSQYKIDCRFNKAAIIKSIEELSKYANSIEIYNEDALSFMQNCLRYRRRNSFFVYIDPPYYKAGPELYRYYYKKQDHEVLAKYLKNKTFAWLLSYDDVPEIRDLYEKNSLINLYLDYSVRTSRKGSEILISNLEIPPLSSNIKLVQTQTG